MGEQQPWQFGVISIFPEMLQALHSGIPGRALERGLIELHHFNPRDYTTDKHRTIDDRPYGGGPGMVMLAQPLADAVNTAKATLGNDTEIIYLSPQGRKINQAVLQQYCPKKRLVLVAGRYEGVDERFIAQYVDEEWSLGDYVISGGELAAMVIIDAITRLLPGVLGHELSSEQDSFVSGLLDYPHYTRPEHYAGMQVPEVLLSGNHQAIHRWRMKQALGRTWQRRPDLLATLELTALQKQLLAEYQQEGVIP